MTKYEAFEKLKEYANKLNEVSYDEIYDLIAKGIRQVPMPLAKVYKGASIDRVRKNRTGELFKHVDELGYIKESSVIEKFTSFGRANCPHQIMFYGALETKLIDKQRLTAIAETSSLLRIPNQDCHDGETYTVSRWENQQEMIVVEVVFSEFALANNDEIRNSFEKQKSFLASMNLTKEDFDFNLEFLVFISEQFAKKVSDHNEYKISAVYTNMALKHPEVRGICYPSVQTDYFGVNIVLPPQVVDKNLIPKTCSTHVVYKNGKHTLIANGGEFSQNISFDKNIEWQSIDERYLTPLNEVRKHIHLPENTM